MKNLAGNKECDREIAQELRRSMISSIPYEGRLDEVPSRLRGKIGPFEFKRAWTYWVVRGPVPLAVAHELYEDPVGRTDIRVDGHCAQPPPEAPWVTWFLPNGQEVVPTSQKAEFDRIANSDSDVLRKVIADSAHKYVFHDAPASIGAAAYVGCYHIDSEVGLRVFCDTIRKYGLDKTQRPSWWPTPDA